MEAVMFAAKIKASRWYVPLRDEIECCYNEQLRRHLGDDQGPWLTPKILCETI